MDPNRTVVIDPDVDSLRALREVWRFRELTWELGVRAVAVHYKQTLIGVLWAVIRPVAAAGLLTLVFSGLIGKHSFGWDYGLLVIAGLSTYQLFASVIGGTAETLTGNAAMLNKVYVPRMSLALAKCATGLVDAVVVGILIVVVGGVINGLSPRVVLLPLGQLLGIGAAFGPGLMLAIVNARYRDVRYVLPFMLQILLLAAPIAYATSDLPWRPLEVAYVFPLIGAIDLVRWSVIPDAVINWQGVGVSVAVTVALNALALRFFLRNEAAVIDLL
jgi:lipopolysaccharide transport system permease protein